VFGILACTYIFGSLAFIFMGSGELQSWNNPPEIGDRNKNPEEGEPLKDMKEINGTEKNEAS
jgi:ACS family sodium-dependent inorganic phosphate cotransporter